MFRRNILFFLIFLLINVGCQDSNVPILEVTQSSGSFKYDESVTQLQINIYEFNTKYVKLQVSADGISQNFKGDIFVLKNLSENPTTPDNLILQSGHNKNYIYIPKADVINSADTFDGTFFVTLVGVQMNYKATFTYENSIEIDPDETYTFISSETVSEHVFNYTAEFAVHNFFAIGTVKNDVEFVSLLYHYGEQEEDLTSTAVTKNDTFYNGFVVSANVTDKTAEGAYYLLTVKTTPNSLIKVGVEVVDQSDLMVLKDGLTYNGYLLHTTSTKCFFVPNANGYIRMISKSGVKSYITYTNTEDGTEVRESEQTIRETGYQYIEGSETLKYLCLAPLPGESNADYEIQYLDTSHTVIEMNPLINGLSYEFNLTKGTYQTYQYKKHLDSEREVIFNVRAIEGHVDVKILSVHDFPITVITDIALTNAEKLHDLNGYFFKNTYHKGKHAWSNEQDLLLVQCLDNEYNENNCRFEVAFVDDEDPFSLKSNLRYLQYVKAESYGNYVFSMKEDNVEKILIELNKIAGDALMYVTVPNENELNGVKTYHIGNKKVIEITCQQEDCTDLKREYKIQTYSSRGSVYTVSYFIYKKSENENAMNEIDIDGGMQILEFLRKDTSQVYKMQNQHKALQIPYVVNFFPINCEIDISFKVGEEEEHVLAFTDHFIQHEITKEMGDLYTSNDYYYIISANDMEHHMESLNYENEMCLVQIASTSLDPEAEMIINEGTPTDFKFNSITQNVTYVFPHIARDENIIAKIDAEIETELIITYKINGNAKEPIHFAKSGHFIIEKSEIQEHCQDESICPIVFSIVAINENDINEGVSIEFMVKPSNSYVPSYLKKFKLREDFIYEDQTPQYFVTEIGPGETGTVALNFIKGHGYLLAKFVPKTSNADDNNADWNGQIYFPSTTDPDTLFTFNNVTGEFKFDSAQTEQCTNGCELYLAVIPTSAFDDSLSEFTIYINSEYEEIKPVDIPINEYIHGAVYNADDIRYYTFNIPMKVEEVNIELSGSCKMAINEGIDLPEVDESSFELYNEGTSRVHRLASSTTSTKVYTAAIKCDDSFLHVNYSPFYFRVRTVQHNEKEIIDVKSNHEIVCETKEGYCYFIIPVNPHEYNQSISMHTWAMDDISEQLSMYARVVSKKVYDAMSQADKESWLPTIENNQHSSKDTLMPDILDIHLEIEETSYVLVSVYSVDQTTQLTFLYTDRTAMSTVEIVDYSSKLVRVATGSTATLTLPKETGATIYAYTASGKGTYIVNGEQSYEATGYGMIFEFNKQSTDEIQITVMNVENEPFIFFAWYQVYADGNNMNEIEFSTQSNYISKNADFPLIVYLGIWEGEDVTANFYINNLVKVEESGSASSSDDLQVDTYIINSSKLNELKRDTSATLENPITSQVIKHTSSHVIQVTTYAENIKTEHSKANYLIYVINKHESNTNVYKQFEITSNVFGSQYTWKPLQPGRYFYDKLKQGKNFNIYKLSKRRESDASITIEFSAINEKIVHYLTNTDIPIDGTITEQGTNLPCAYNEIGGKHTYNCNFNEVGDAVYLAVYAIEDISNDDFRKYVLRYTLNTQLKLYTVPTELTVAKEGDDESSIKVTFNSIISDSHSIDADYYVKVYHVSEQPSEHELFGRIIEPKNTPSHMVSATSSTSNIIEVPLAGINKGVNYITVIAYVKSTQEWLAFGVAEYTFGIQISEYDYNKIHTFTRSSFTNQIAFILKAPETNSVFSIKTYNFKYTGEVKTLNYFKAEANYLTEEEKNALQIGNEYERTTTIVQGEQYVQDNYIIFKMPNEQPEMYKYIYITMQKDEERNQNEYEDFSIDILAYNPSISNTLNVPTNRYYIGELESAQVNYYHISMTEGMKYLTVDVIEKKANSVNVEFKNAQTQETITAQALELTTSKRLFIQSETPIDVSVVVSNTVEQGSYYMIKFVLTENEYNNEPSFDKELTATQLEDNLHLSFELLNSKYTKVIYNTEITESIRDETTSSLFYDKDGTTRNTIVSEYHWVEQTETVTRFDKDIKLPQETNVLYIYVNVFAEDSVTGEEMRANYTMLTHTPVKYDTIPFGTYTSLTFKPNKVEFVLVPEATEDIYNFIFKFDREVTDAEFNVEFAFVSDKFVVDYYTDGTMENVDKHPIILHVEDKAAFVNLRNAEQYKYVAVFTQNLMNEISCEGVIFKSNEDTPSFKLPQLKYFIDGFGEKMYKVYGLEYDSNAAKLEIEYSTKYFSRTIEFLVLNGNEDVACETTVYPGKNVITCDILQTYTNLVFKIHLEELLIGSAAQAVIFKYKTLTADEKSNLFICDTDLKMHKDNDGKHVFTISNPSNEDKMDFIYKLFDRGEGVSKDEINTIYDSILPEVTGSFNYPLIRDKTYISEGDNSTNVSFQFGIDESYYFVVTAFYTDAATNEEHKCNYNILEFNTKVIVCEDIQYGQFNERTLTDYKGEKIAYYAKVEVPHSYVTVHLKLSNVEYSEKSDKFQNRFKVEGYYVNSTFIKERQVNDNIVPPEGTVKIEGEQYLFEHEIILKYKNVDSNDDMFIFFEISIDQLPDDLYYKSLTINMGVFDKDHDMPLQFGDHHVNMLDDVKTQTTYIIDVPSDNTNSIYIEFGERYNTKKLELIASTDKDATVSNVEMKDRSLPGKRVFIIENINQPLYLTFKNTKLSLTEYFVKVLKDTKENLENYIEYDTEPKFSLANKEVSFENILSKINRIYDTGYTAIKYKVVVYRKDKNDDGNVEELESLFLNKVGDEPQPYGFEAVKEVESEEVTKDIELISVDLKGILQPNQKYFIQVTYHSESLITSDNEMHRFAFKNIEVQLVPFILKEIDLNNVQPICFDTHIDEFGFYFAFDQTREIAPQISLRYYGIKYAQNKISPDIFNIKGYTVDQAFIDEKKVNDEAPVPSTGVEAKYLVDDNLAFLSFDELSKNEYVFVDVSRREDNKNKYKNICFEIIPETGNVVLEPSTYYYSKLIAQKGTSFIIERTTQGQRYLTVEVITNSPETGVEIGLVENPESDYVPFLLNTRQIDNFKVRFEYSLDESTSMFFTVTINKKSVSSEQTRSLAEENDLILVKYDLDEDSNRQEISFTKDMNVTRTKEKLTITFENIDKNNQMQKLKEITYHVNVFKNTTEQSEIDTYMIDTEKNKPIYSESKSSETNEQITFTFTLTDDTNGNDLYVTLLVTAVNEKDEIMKLKYNLATAVFIPSEPTDPTVQLPWWIFVLIGVGVVAIFLIVFTIVKSYRKKNKDKFNIDNMHNEMKLIDSEDKQN